MSLARNPGRFAGMLFLLMSLPAPFALLYLPGKLIVQGNAAATANNIAVHETLFRLGMTAEVLNAAGFLFVVLALYRLLEGVNRKHAMLMVTLFAISVPISFLNVLNEIAALMLVRGADFLSVFDKPQRDALALMFLRLHGQGVNLAAVFWGLWLFPLGMLVYRSGFFPRILGVLLIVNCFAYPAITCTSLLLPQYLPVVSRLMTLPETGELWFILWLLIRGADPKSLAGSDRAPAA